MGTNQMAPAVGENSGQVCRNEVNEKTATRSCLRTLAFIQLWLGSVLIIVGIALSAAYGVFFLALLVDGIMTVASAACGAATIFYIENRCLYYLRMILTCFQIFYGIVLVFLYIWCAVDIHIAFVAFVVIEAVQVFLAVFIMLVYTNRYHIYTYCCISDEERAATPSAEANINGGRIANVHGNTNIHHANYLSGENLNYDRTVHLDEPQYEYVQPPPYSQ